MFGLNFEGGFWGNEQRDRQRKIIGGRAQKKELGFKTQTNRTDKVSTKIFGLTSFKKKTEEFGRVGMRSQISICLS